MNKFILLLALVTLISANFNELNFLENNYFINDSDRTVECRVNQLISFNFMDNEGQYEIIKPSRANYKQFITGNYMEVVPKTTNFSIKIAKYDYVNGDRQFTIHFNCNQFLF
jgi:hypothetical protein